MSRGVPVGTSAGTARDRMPVETPAMPSGSVKVPFTL
jgi:hypothetical protein